MSYNHEILFYAHKHLKSHLTSIWEAQEEVIEKQRLEILRLNSIIEDLSQQLGDRAEEESEGWLEKYGY